MSRTADLLTHNLGTIITIAAQTTRGRRWLAANVPDAADDCAMAEHRYGIDILLGALGDGLTLEDATTGRQADTVPEELS